MSRAAISVESMFDSSLPEFGERPAADDAAVVDAAAGWARVEAAATVTIRPLAKAYQTG